MMIFGINLKHPSTKELTLITCVMIFYTVLFLWVFPYFQFEQGKSIHVILMALFIGILSSSFGINASKGWNHVLLLLIISLILWLFIIQF
jgi:hypothetical protein